MNPDVGLPLTHGVTHSHTHTHPNKQTHTKNVYIEAQQGSSSTTLVPKHLAVDVSLTDVHESSGRGQVIAASSSSSFPFTSLSPSFSLPLHNTLFLLPLLPSLSLASGWWLWHVSASLVKEKCTPIKPHCYMCDSSVGNSSMWLG